MVFVDVSVCVSAIGVHISELNCTKISVCVFVCVCVCVGGGEALLHGEKVMGRLVLQLDHQEAYARPLKPENRNPPAKHVLNISGFNHLFLGNCWTDFN